MNEELTNLYKELIFDHNKSPRNFREIEEATCCSDGYNPLCGDKVKLFLNIKDGKIEDISFTGKGCAISTASVSILTTVLKGRKIEEANVLFDNFINMLTGKSFEEKDVGKLIAFSGVKKFPVRIKCATLAWHTLKSALKEVYSEPHNKDDQQR